MNKIQDKGGGIGTWTPKKYPLAHCLNILLTRECDEKIRLLTSGSVTHVHGREPLRHLT